MDTALRLPPSHLPQCDDETAMHSIRNHYRRGEKACDSCKAKRNEVRRLYRLRNPKPIRPRALIRPDCGTYNGWTYHYNHKEDPCTACKFAKNAYVREHRNRERGKRTMNTNRKSVTISVGLFRDLYLNVDPSMASEVMARADAELGRDVVDKSIEIADKAG